MSHNDDRPEQGLRHLRWYAKKVWLKDAEMSVALRDRILDKTLGSPNAYEHLSVKTRSAWKSRFSQVGAAILACIIAMGGLAAYRLGHGSIRVNQQTADPWQNGFQPIPDQLVQDQFTHVKTITLSIGNVQPIGQNVATVTVTLTHKEQIELASIMRSAQIKTTNQVDTSPLLYRISFFGPRYSAEGSYGSNGTMYLPGDINLGQNNTGNIFKARRALAQFVQRIAMEPLANQLRGSGKILPSSAWQAALQFTHSLGHPKQAFQYCIPTVYFTDGLSFQNLANDAVKKGYNQYQVQTVTPLDTGSDLVRLSPPHATWFSTVLELRVTAMGSRWIVTQVGRNLTAGSYFGNPPYGPIGKDHVLIIGDMKPKDMTLPYTMIGYNNTTSPAYQTASVLVFERQPLSGRSNAKADKIIASSKKFIPGHPDTHAVQALRNSAVFQKALSEVRRRHAILMVAGNQDGRLNRDTVVDALGNVKSNSGYDMQQTQVVTVQFQSKQSAWVSGSSFVNNGKQLPLDGQMLTDAINQAAGQLDSGIE